MSDYRRITVLSRVLSGVALVIMIGLPLALAWFWFTTSPEALRAVMPTPAAAAFDPTTEKRAIGFAISLLPVCVAIYALAQLRRLFAGFAAGAFFTEESIRALKRFAATCLAAILVHITARAALSVFITFDNPPGQRMLSIEISSNDLFLALFSGLFFLIAWIMDEGRKIATENAEIV